MALEPGNDAQTPLSRFNLQVKPGAADDFEALRWSLSPICEIDADDPGERRDYRHVSDIYASPELAISTGGLSATRFDRTEPVIARSSLDGIVAHVYSQGEHLLESAGSQTLLKPGDIAFLDMTRTVCIRSTASSTLMVGISRHLLTPHFANLDGLHGQVLRQGDPLNTVLGAHLRVFSQEAPRMNFAHATAVAAATANLFAACATPSASRTQMATEAVAEAKLRMIRQEIERQIGNLALGPEWLTKKFSMSRASLYRMFDPLGGVTSYVQKRRLTHARQILIDPLQFGERISEVARRCGFTDAAVFSRAFRQAYGVAPSEIREVGRERDLLLASKVGDLGGAFRGFNHWLSAPEATSAG